MIFSLAAGIGQLPQPLLLADQPALRKRRPLLVAAGGSGLYLAYILHLC
jgi:hypothetical protein